jgi:hypothetical protein
MKPTAFYFEHNITLRDFEQLLIAEDPSLKTGVEFYVSDGQKDVMVTDKSSNFLRLLQYENLKIRAGDRTLSYDVSSPLSSSTLDQMHSATKAPVQT